MNLYRSLAKAIGLNEAIVLQQLIFLLSCQGNGKTLADGERYIYNTYQEWLDQYFTFWTEPTLKRIFQRMERRGLIVSKQPEGGISRRKYYRPSLGALEKLTLEMLREKEADGSKCVTMGSKVALPDGTDLIRPRDQKYPIGGAKVALPMYREDSREDSKEDIAERILATPPQAGASPTPSAPATRERTCFD